jgi:hypothetical protein
MARHSSPSRGNGSALEPLSREWLGTRAPLEGMARHSSPSRENGSALEPLSREWLGTRAPLERMARHSSPSRENGSALGEPPRRPPQHPPPLRRCVSPPARSPKKTSVCGTGRRQPQSKTHRHSKFRKNQNGSSHALIQGISLISARGISFCFQAERLGAKRPSASFSSFHRQWRVDVVFSSCRSGFSFPIWLLTPPAMVVCLSSLRASTRRMKYHAPAHSCARKFATSEACDPRQGFTMSTRGLFETTKVRGWRRNGVSLKRRLRLGLQGFTKTCSPLTRAGRATD